MDQLLKTEQLDKKEEESKEESYESLNSHDDLSEKEESVDTGRNLLLGYYEKTSWKRNRRKIVIWYGILRVEDVDLILPYIKGNFDWITNWAN